MTKTEICNRALGVLGHDRTIDDFETDQSTEAQRCRAFYNSAVLNCLAEHDWDFAAVERELGVVAPDQFGWARFPVPADALRISSVCDPQGRPLKTRRQLNFILVETLGGPARMRYITSDITEIDFPHKFTEAVIHQLAALISGPMFGDSAKTNSFMSLAAQKLSDAVTKETDETAYRGEWRNPFINARR